jgi:hypothetical protein
MCARCRFSDRLKAIELAEPVVTNNRTFLNDWKNAVEGLPYTVQYKRRKLALKARSRPSLGPLLLYLIYISHRSHLPRFTALFESCSPCPAHWTFSHHLDVRINSQFTQFIGCDAKALAMAHFPTQCSGLTCPAFHLQVT